MLVEGDNTRLDDLALVCANCHRLIHGGKPWLTLDDLRRYRSEASYEGGSARKQPFAPLVLLQ